MAADRLAGPLGAGNRPRRGRRWPTWLALVLLLFAGGSAAVSVWVQWTAAPRTDDLGGPGPARALVLYHPSRDAGFSDELSLALAEGLRDAGLHVTRMTTTEAAPARPEGYALVAVVANTFWLAPDRPTRRWLERARLDGLPVLGVIAGAGSTDRAQRLLETDLRSAGAASVQVRPAWISRPNGDVESAVPNRVIAAQQVRAFGAAGAQAAIAAGR